MTEPAQVEMPKAEAEAPLEGIPEDGKSYVQLGSVERGFAILMTQGLRKRGIASLMAKGAAPAVFRVLAGPYETPEELEKAKAMFAEMGLKTFSRKYP